MSDLTELTIDERRDQIEEVRSSLKELVKEQKEDKAALKKPHIDYMGGLMLDVLIRSNKITSLHANLNDLCGKPNSHQRKG